MANDLIARDRAVLWHPCSHLRDDPPLTVVGAQGVYLHLADGRRLIDGIASWWCRSLGHGHPRLRQALVEAPFEHVILANTTNEPVVRLCERLLALANRGGTHFGKVFFADNGSTAVEVALKFALQWQQQTGSAARTRFAALAGAYHGETAGAMSVSDLGLYKHAYAPLCVDTLHLGPLPERASPEDAEWMDASREWPAIATQLDAQVATLAAVIVEPVLLGAGGMRCYSPDLLRRLRGWCDAHGVLLIADEIAAGMGRMGTMLACELAGVQPDLAILSKALTGGTLPMATVLIAQHLVSAFDHPWDAGRSFLHSNTFAGNALAVAVANATLDVYADEQVLALVATRGPRLRAGLAALAATRPWLRNVRGCGMVAAADLIADPARRAGWQVCRAGFDHGVFLRPLGNTVYLCPPLTISDHEIDALLRGLAAALDAVAQP